MKYFSNDVLPDVGIALTSAYYFAAGFEAPQGVLTQSDLDKLGVGLVEDREVDAMLRRYRHFARYDHHEVNNATDLKLDQGVMRTLLEQRMKEGRSEEQARQELTIEARGRLISRNMKNDSK